MATPQSSGEHLIGSATAATILGKSQRTVQRLVESGDLTPVPLDVAGAHVFRRADVEALAAKTKESVA